MMCGIVGYCGKTCAVSKIMSGLKKLEYRGYDSGGIALFENGKIQIKKAVGKLTELEKKIGETDKISMCGIGHTRWATHGAPTLANAHPHSSDDGSVVLVHNGIIENHKELREKLSKHGYSFYSETDTEVLAKLVHYYLVKYGKPMDALARVCLRAVGSYAVCIMFECDPGAIYAIRLNAPLVVGKGKGECVVASDVSAVIETTKDVAYVENHEIVRIDASGEVCFFTIDQEPIKKRFETTNISAQDTSKNGYPHYMLKEIFEQPMALVKTIGNYVCDGKVSLGKKGPTDDVLKNCKMVHVVACGSAYHAGLVGAHTLETIAKVQTKCYLASEFCTQKVLMHKSDLVLFVSQSGETADTLSAMRKAKKLGAKTIAIANVVSSSLAREADYALPTFAGPEISVATTKAYSAQIAVLHIFALKIAFCRQKVAKTRQKNCILNLLQLPIYVSKVLSKEHEVQKIASYFLGKREAFFLGRGVDFFVAQEASLKLKEVSYVHSEAFASGELKHGTISLIEKGSLVVGICSSEEVAKKLESNLFEAKSRGAEIVFVRTTNVPACSFASCEIVLPQADELLAPLVTIVPLQFLAYFVALQNGSDVDRPRNLAKSVTVE